MFLNAIKLWPSDDDVAPSHLELAFGSASLDCSWMLPGYGLLQYRLDTCKSQQPPKKGLPWVPPVKEHHAQGR